MRAEPFYVHENQCTQIINLSIPSSLSLDSEKKNAIVGVSFEFYENVEVLVPGGCFCMDPNEKLLTRSLGKGSWYQKNLNFNTHESLINKWRMKN